MSSESEKAFSRAAGIKPRGSIADFLRFIALNKKWWLTPIIVVILIVGVIAILGSTGAAPFIYTLF